MVSDGLGAALGMASLLMPEIGVGVAMVKMSGSGDDVGVKAAWAVAVASRGGLASWQAERRSKKEEIRRKKEEFAHLLTCLLVFCLSISFTCSPSHPLKNYPQAS